MIVPYYTITKYVSTLEIYRTIC